MTNNNNAWHEYMHNDNMIWIGRVADVMVGCGLYGNASIWLHFKHIITLLSMFNQ